MSRALVTGASGFIGATLSSLLAERGWGVRALMRHPVAGPWDETFRCDLGRGEIPQGALAGVDTLFHLAGKAHALAPPGDDGAVYRRVNVEGTRALVAAAESAGVQRLVYFSSVKVLDPPERDNPYSASKRAAERLVLESAIPHVCCLRPVLVYGPGHRGNLERMARAIDRRLLPPLPPVGNLRAMVHVRDLARAALMAAEAPIADRKCYVVADGEGYSTTAIQSALAGALGRPPRGWHLPLPLLQAAARVGDLAGRVTGRRFPLDSETLEKLVGSAWYDVEPLRRELGFAPDHGFFETVGEMVDGFTDRWQARPLAAAGEAGR